MYEPATLMQYNDTVKISRLNLQFKALAQHKCLDDRCGSRGGGVLYGVLVGDDTLAPAGPLAVVVVLHVGHPAARGPHHAQGLRVQDAGGVEPKEHLHVLQLRGEGGLQAALPAAQEGISVQVVVLLQVGLEMIYSVAYVFKGFTFNTACRIMLWNMI